MSRTRATCRPGLAVVAAALLAGGAAAAGAPLILQAVDLGGLETRSAALLLSGEEAGDLEVAPLVIPLPAADGPARVILVVEVSGPPLLAAAGSGRLLVEVYVYALDAGGGLAAALTQAFRLDGAARELLPRGGVQLFGHLDLPPGEYSLRVLVLHRASGRLGLRTLPLSVSPGRGEGQPLLLPPLRRRQSEGWVLVHAAGSAPPPFPLTLGGRAWLPAPSRAVAAGDAAGFLLFGRGLDRGLRARLLGAEREEVAEVGLGDLRSGTGGPQGLETLAAAVDTRDLPAGEHRLEIEAAGGAARASAPLVIRPAGPSTEAPERAPASAEATRRPADPARRYKRHARVGAAYARALGALAAGDRAAATAAVVELETTEIGGGERGERDALAEGELRAAVELAGGDAEGLLPAMRLHEELYRRYHRRRQYQLATHSRRLVERLAELYLEHSASPRARHLVACALVSMAGYLHETGALPAAEAIYRQALHRDPHHQAALIGLAALREHYGDYRRAAELLEQVRASPPDPEVRLRLAVNLRRTRSTRRAEELLRAAIDAPGPEWIAAVAAQELASLLAAERRAGEAVGVLEAAVERHREVQRLRVQLASLLDRSGRGAEARAALAGLDPRAGRDEGSPRLRYSDMPAAALAAARRDFAEAADRQLAGLRPAGPGAPETPAAGDPAAGDPAAGDPAAGDPAAGGR